MLNLQFDCLDSHLSGFGHWEDRLGEPQTYFYGTNYGQQVCACSSNDTCHYTPKSDQHCNCDITPTRGTWRSDSGIITNKTGMVFSRTSTGCPICSRTWVGLTLIWVFHLAQLLLPNSHQSRQNWVGSGKLKIHVNPIQSRSRWDNLYSYPSPGTMWLLLMQ